MDFANLKVSDTATLKLKNPKTGLIIDGAEIDLMGRDCTVFKQMVREEARMQAQGIKQDVDSVEENSLKKTAQMTVAIRGVEENGKPITDALYLYKTYPWAFEQAQLFILTRSNFLPNA